MTEKILPHRSTGGLGGSSEEGAVPDLDLTNVCFRTENLNSTCGLLVVLYSLYSVRCRLGFLGLSSPVCGCIPCRGGDERGKYSDRLWCRWIFA